MNKSIIQPNHGNIKLTDEFLSDVAKYGESKVLLRQIDRNNAKLQEAINGN